MESREQQRRQQFAMISSWQQSGQTQKQYCEQNNIAYHIFHYWYKVFREAQSVASGSFVSLNIAAPLQPNVEMFLTDGRRIIFHQPVSADFLKALIS